MINVQRAKVSDLPAVVALSDEVFRRPGQTSMGKAFCKLFSPDNAANLLIVKDEDRPVALMGLMPSIARIGQLEIPVVSMGSVCTHPDYRGRMYASQLMGEALRHMQENGTVFLLVSGERSLYTRNDCLVVGQVHNCQLTSENLSTVQRSAGEILPYTDADISAMRALYRAQDAHFERSEEDFRELAQAGSLLSCYPADQHIWVYKQGGIVEAYIVFGTIQRDDSLVGQIIEFAGEDEAVLACAAQAISQFGLKGLSLTVPNYRRALSERLAGMDLTIRTESHPGTVRLINFSRLWDLLAPYREQNMRSVEEFAALEVHPQADGVRFALGNETATFDARGLTKLVLEGPSIVGNSALKRALSTLFPLPFVYPNDLNYI